MAGRHQLRALWPRQFHQRSRRRGQAPKRLTRFAPAYPCRIHLLSAPSPALAPDFCIFGDKPMSDNENLVSGNPAPVPANPPMAAVSLALAENLRRDDRRCDPRQ